MRGRVTAVPRIVPHFPAEVKRKSVDARRLRRSVRRGILSRQRTPTPPQHDEERLPHPPPRVSPHAVPPRILVAEPQRHLGLPHRPLRLRARARHRREEGALRQEDRRALLPGVQALRRRRRRLHAGRLVPPRARVPEGVGRQAHPPALRRRRLPRGGLARREVRRLAQRRLGAVRARRHGPRQARREADARRARARRDARRPAGRRQAERPLLLGRLPLHARHRHLADGLGRGHPSAGPRLVPHDPEPRHERGRPRAALPLRRAGRPLPRRDPRGRRGRRGARRPRRAGRARLARDPRRPRVVALRSVPLRPHAHRGARRQGDRQGRELLRDAEGLVRGQPHPAQRQTRLPALRARPGLLPGRRLDRALGRRAQGRHRALDGRRLQRRAPPPEGLRGPLALLGRPPRLPHVGRVSELGLQRRDPRGAAQLPRGVAGRRRRAARPPVDRRLVAAQRVDRQRPRRVERRPERRAGPPDAGRLPALRADVLRPHEGDRPDAPRERRERLRPLEDRPLDRPQLPRHAEGAARVAPAEEGRPPHRIEHARGRAALRGAAVPARRGAARAGATTASASRRRRTSSTASATRRSSSPR